MDSIDYFDKRDSRNKGKKELDAEWSNLKKVRTGLKKDKKEQKPVVFQEPEKKID